MKLTQVTIQKRNANFAELHKLSEILNTKEIKTNGKIVVKTDLECDIHDIRKQIKEAMNCSYSEILCTYNV